MRINRAMVVMAEAAMDGPVWGRVSTMAIGQGLQLPHPVPRSTPESRDSACSGEAGTVFGRSPPACPGVNGQTSGQHGPAGAFQVMRPQKMPVTGYDIVALLLKSVAAKVPRISQRVKSTVSSVT